MVVSSTCRKVNKNPVFSAKSNGLEPRLPVSLPTPTLKCYPSEEQPEHLTRCPLDTSKGAVENSGVGGGNWTHTGRFQVSCSALSYAHHCLTGGIHRSITDGCPLLI